MQHISLKHALCSMLLTSAIVFFAGCGQSGSNNNAGTNTGSTAALPADLLLTSAPDGAQTIMSLKESAEEGDEVVVHVIVGGKMQPHVAGRASAAIIDAGLDNPCTGEDDHCQTPWDYCCTPQEEITANLATLQIVDEDGRPLAVDLAEQFPAMAVLTIRGVVGPRPDPQVLTINATGIYIEQGTP